MLNPELIDILPHGIPIATYFHQLRIIKFISILIEPFEEELFFNLPHNLSISINCY